MENNRFLPVKGKPLSPFISKLKALLADERFRRAIKWCENGSAIVISDGETFKKLVLDQNEEMKMFKTRNFASFVRQLNLYGFKKVPVNGKADPSKNMKFEHQNFKRDHPEQMYKVHRTCPRKSKVNRNVKTQFTKRTAVLHSARKSRYKCYADECVGPDGENSDSETSSVASLDSRSTTPNKQYFGPSPLEPQSALETAAAQQYMYQKLQEEQMVVQLLLSLKNSSPLPSNCENFQPSTTGNAEYTQSAGHYFYPPPPPTANFYPAFSHIY